MTKYNITTIKEKDASYRTMVNPNMMDDLEEKINDIIIIQKKYRDKSYSARRLSEDLGTNTRYISAVVNVRFHMNYASLVNSYRFREAMSMLVDKRYQNLTMEEISDMVGFSNRQSFYASFYKINQCTPREYKILQNSRYAQKQETDKKTGGKRGRKKAKAEDGNEQMPETGVEQ